MAKHLGRESEESLAKWKTQRLEFGEAKKQLKFGGHCTWNYRAIHKGSRDLHWDLLDS